MCAHLGLINGKSRSLSCPPSKTDGLHIRRGDETSDKEAGEGGGGGGGGGGGSEPSFPAETLSRCLI